MAKKKKRTTVAKTAAAPAIKDECCATCRWECGAWGMLLLRVVLGAAFIWHGLPKLLNYTAAAGFFQSLGFWGWLAAVVGVIEVLGGLMLVLGVYTRYAAYALALVMLGAIILVKKFAWPAIELDLVLLASLLALAWNGSGKWALWDKNCC